jgi:HSP20 family molecular chaperone IbpA
MNRTSSPGGPVCLSFEDWPRLAAHLARGPAEGYPPYNIEHIGQRGLRVTVAVAGFSIEDLSVIVEDRCLVIRGRKPDDAVKRVFLHRGLAARPFQRIFRLGEDVEVGGATLQLGLLQIDLHPVRQPSQPRRIPISRGAAHAAGTEGDADA